MSGIQCQEIKVNSGFGAQFERAVEKACTVMLERTGGNGFPVIVESGCRGTVFFVSQSSLLAAVQRVVVAPPLIYTQKQNKKNNNGTK